ncbi:MAG: hypothetical protein HRU75_12670 [Planctomycetia bacterium]|nr:MAG: hypothetical protein HRU75_12670 [Planctomycetia bacterium]
MLASFSAQFTAVDWLVVLGYLALTTVIGARMAGRQQTFRDFFLGGRKLPWYAVSGSIVATEISALTFVSVPWVVFQPGGNFTYLQLGVFGSFFARILVGYFVVPAYYKREIYSPYDYMQNQLGGPVRSVTTGLFTLSSVLAQSARIYLTAEVINVVMHDQLAWLSERFGLNELAWAILLLSVVATAWTLLGGITTVIWTDVVLFAAFLIGAFVALGAIVGALDGGFAELLRVAYGAVESGVPWAEWGKAQASGAWGKLTFFDWRADPTRAYTIWAAVIASTWGGLGAYGTDQLMAQRMFCCRNVREARWAIISSAVSQVVTITVALVGAGLYVYYVTHAPSDAARALLATKQNGDRIFPVFVVEVVPIGLKGLIIAAIFAAAISSIMGVLTALSQTVQTAFYNPWRARVLAARGHSVELVASAEHAEGGEQSAEDRRSVLVGRLLVIGWAVVLSILAYQGRALREHYASLLDLGLALAGYCGGGLLAGFALAILPVRVNSRGYVWSAPMSVLCIYGIAWHDEVAQYATAVGGAVMLGLWALIEARRVDRPERDGRRDVLSLPARAVVVMAGAALPFVLARYGILDAETQAELGLGARTLAWPWYVPVGSIIAFAWGYLLAERVSARNDDGSAAEGPRMGDGR